MSNDLKRLVRGVEGEGPSAEFRARLRAQIVAETEDAESTSDDIVVVVDLKPEPDAEAATRSTPRTGLLLTAAAVVIAIIGIWMSTTGDDESGVDVTTEIDDEDVIAAEPITVENTVFDAGVFRIDTLGTPFTFEVEQQTGALANGNGTVSITALTSRNADDRTITFRRTSLLPDPSAPTGRVDPSTAWPAADLRGWLALTGDALAATEAIDTSLGGFPATFVELEVPCDGGPCRTGDLIDEPDLPLFTPGSTYLLWVVDQGEEDPIVITVAIEDQADNAWFGEAEEILASLRFGQIEPNPVRRLSGGAVEIAAFDGISLELPGETTVVEPYDGFARLFSPEINGDVEFLTRPLDSFGVDVASTERLIQLLEVEAVQLVELEPADVHEQTARVFSINSGPFSGVVLNTREEDLANDVFGWAPPRLGHLWVIEHPDRGLLLISSETSVEPDELFTWAEQLVASLEFRSR